MAASAALKPDSSPSLQAQFYVLQKYSVDTDLR